MTYDQYKEVAASGGSLSQELLKELAKNVIGDGQSPNLWFVTRGPYVMVQGEDGEQDEEKIDGFDSYTYGPFTSYPQAVNFFEDLELSYKRGVGQVFIEDRQCGVVREKFLTKRVKVVYEETEYDDSKLFYKD